MNNLSLAVLVLFALQIAALVGVALTVLAIKNGPILALVSRFPPIVKNGTALAKATQKRLARMQISFQGITGNVTGMKSAWNLSSPEGMWITPATLRRGLAAAATLRAISVRKKTAREDARRDAQTGVRGGSARRRKTKRPPMLVERLGLIPPILRPALGLWRYRHIAQGFLKGLRR